MSKKQTELTIGVFTPYFQGDYLGEIFQHLRSYISHRGYRILAVRTNSFGAFPVALGIDHMDAVIILRNAIHPKLVEKLLNRNIPVVAIAHDYFPLDVPVIAVDNSAGVDAAFDFLSSRNHQRFLFIGDLTHYDILKRYERFKERLTQFNPSACYDPLICTPNALIDGGMVGAKEFIHRHERATGILFGAGHTAVGFTKHLEETLGHFPETLDMVAFDNIKVMDHLTPNVVRLDQNLQQLALEALNTLESIYKGSNYLNQTILIKPSLFHVPPPNAKDNSEFYISESASFSALTSNRIEIIKNIVKSDLKDIMVLSPFFSKFMRFGVLSKLVFDKNNKQHLETVYRFGGNDFEPQQTVNEARNSNLETHPGAILSHLHSDNTCGTFSFPIFIERDLWGFISFLGEYSENDQAVYTEFTITMDTIAQFYGLELHIKELEDYEELTQEHAPTTSTFPETPCATLQWDLERGLVSWNDLALELLGFTSDFERTIYRTMDILDRIHDDDQIAIREEISNSLNRHVPMTTVVRLKTAGGLYRKFSFQGEITKFEDDDATEYKCILSQIN